MIYTAGNNYYSEEERALIRGVFKDNHELLKVLRKTMIPKVDENTPGSLIDVYSSIPFARLSAEDAKILGTARNMLMDHLNIAINSLWSLANQEPKTKEEIEEARKKDSTK